MMDEIETLEDLVESLLNCEGDEYLKVSSSLNLDPNEVSKYATWSEEEYTRNCLARNEDFELILLCWEPGQATPIHGHNDNECWVHVVSGELEETLYEYDVESKENHVLTRKKLGQRHLSYMNDSMGYHDIKNTSNKRGMTLHLYVGPIDQCEVFDTDRKEFYIKELCYTSETHELLVEK